MTVSYNTLTPVYPKEFPIAIDIPVVFLIKPIWNRFDKYNQFCYKYNLLKNLYFNYLV